MLHVAPTVLGTKRRFVARQRFNLLGSLIATALIPFLIRAAILPQDTFYVSSINGFIFNALAVLVAFWIRLSIETYPGNRATDIILPSAIASHGLMVAILVLTRLPYDRVALLAGLFLHIAWAYGLHVAVHRSIRQQIAIVPFGAVERLRAIEHIDWRDVNRPILDDTVGCDALVADFSAEMPDEWEAFLADAALDGRIVYQVKQLEESLTGRVSVVQLSENSFGSLVPARGYFHLKSVADWLFAVALLPLLLPLFAIVAVAIKLDSPGPVFFRQQRTGKAGKHFRVVKFRTMAAGCVAQPAKEQAITGADDPRITRVGAFLRKSRIDELPQVFNILASQMSWIGPRPEAEVLSAWYTGEIPFYRYRHVVRPGISGWAQVNQGHVASVDEVHAKLQYDFYYIKYFSAWLDVLIVFKTAKTMLTGFGSR